jgi:hypothetical protein
MLPACHCERSEAISLGLKDCFVTALLAMTLSE